MGLNLIKIMDLMIDWVENPQKHPKPVTTSLYPQKIYKPAPTKQKTSKENHF